MKLFGYYKNGAIVQRGKPFTVKGSSRTNVRISVNGKNYNREVVAEIADGLFCAEFPACDDCSSVYKLTVEGDGRTEEVDFRFGDVYLAMGQSNLSYALSAVENAEKWAERVKDKDVAVLSLYEVPSLGGNITRPAHPLSDFIRDYEWTSGADEKIMSTSAICVETAAILCEKGGIPIGFVQTAMGGLSAETYLDYNTALKDEELSAFLKKSGRFASPGDYNTHGGRNYTQLSGVWNEKIAPLKGLNFKGIVWYLGESSAFDYEFGVFFLRTMKHIVSDLRGLFGNIPFAAIQIAPEYYPYGDKYGYLYINEALDDLQKTEDNVTTVPIYDVEPRWLKTNGETYFHPIHTVTKDEVSVRTALALTSNKCLFSYIKEVFYEKGKAICFVETNGKKLRKGSAFGFTLAGKNGKYYGADAVVTGDNEVTVRSDDVDKPEKLSYAFMQYQDFCDLKTEDGLPVLPYRSERTQITDRYFFPPAFTKTGAAEVYENNFGIQAGFCRKVPVWTNGKIYRCNKVKIQTDEKGVLITASSKNEDLFFFGVSPEVCLCGHRNGFDKFKYLKIVLSSTGKADFYGVVFRTCDGEIYRFNLKNGKDTEECLNVGGSEETFTISLKNGISGDGAGKRFNPKLLKSICEAEFLFRSFSKKVSVRISSVRFSDKPQGKKKITVTPERKEARSDMKLPEKNG